MNWVAEKLRSLPIGAAWSTLPIAIVFAAASYLAWKQPEQTALIAGLFALGGYLINHRLEGFRRRRQWKLDQYSQFIGGLRIFICEQHVVGSSDQNVPLNPKKYDELRDGFQESYLPAALLLSRRAFETFTNCLNAFLAFQADSTKLGEFQRLQAELINELRQDCGIQEKIEFRTWDIRLPHDRKAPTPQKGRK